MSQNNKRARQETDSSAA
jgi:hypothetical protein